MNKRTLETTRKLRHHIKGHNKFLTKSFLRSAEPMVLLANAHPLYRVEYAKDLEKAGLITELELKILIEERKAA